MAFSQNEKKSSVEPFYAVEFNLGISTRSEFEYTSKLGVNDFHPFDLYYLESDKPQLTYKTLVFGLNFAGGIKLESPSPYFNFKAGLGIGYLFYRQDDRSLPYVTNAFIFPHTITTHGIPLFVYLRNDFWDGKISPYLDFKIGNNFLITKESVTVYDNYGQTVAVDEGIFRLKNGLYLAANIGVAFEVSPKNRLNVSIGYQLLPRPYDLLLYDDDFPFSIYSDFDEHVKTGYTVIDHQFLLNIGVSF